MSGIGFRETHLNRSGLAAELGCSTRTIARMEHQPNGLPSILLAGRKFYNVDTIRAWLASRERKPNPRRGG